MTTTIITRMGTYQSYAFDPRLHDKDFGLRDLSPWSDFKVKTAEQRDGEYVVSGRWSDDVTATVTFRNNDELIVINAHAPIGEGIDVKDAVERSSSDGRAILKALRPQLEALQAKAEGEAKAIRGAVASLGKDAFER